MEKLQGVPIRMFEGMGGLSSEIKRIQLVQLSFLAVHENVATPQQHKRTPGKIVAPEETYTKEL